MKERKDIGTIKFCVDCKYYDSIRGSFGGKKTQHFCNRPALLNMVTGERSNALNNRNHPSLCGPEARYFEPLENETKEKAQD